jgi:hypothetical protein
VDDPTERLRAALRAALACNDVIAAYRIKFELDQLVAQQREHR